MSTPTRKAKLAGGNTFTGEQILSDETASRALHLDGSKKVKASAVTSTELGRLSGVTSPIQPQLDAKLTTADLKARVDGFLTGLANWPSASTVVGQIVSITSSADGRKVAFVVFNGNIYTSTDFGHTFTSRDSVRDWTGIASSADGTKLVACVRSGQLYTSTDSGVTWTARDSSRKWTGVASSADGTKLVAAEGYDANGNIYTSTDSGVNWTSRASSKIWVAVASSEDGTKLVAAAFGDQLYTSTDSGVNWTARDSARNWISVASSFNGVLLSAAVQNGNIYTSTDSGVTWTSRASALAWIDIRCDRAGQRLVATTGDNTCQYSIDAGVTWVQFLSINVPRCWLSADGMRVWLGSYDSGSGNSTPYYLDPVLSVASNYGEQVAGAGTDYTLTGATARVDFGTTDAEVTLPTAGTYLLIATVQMQGDASGAGDEVRIKLRNSTDGADVGIERSVTTHVASTFETCDLMELVTVTAAKTIQLFAFNATSARGLILAAKTAIRYVRLF
jgi:hypothetical protein